MRRLLPLIFACSTTAATPVIAADIPNPISDPRQLTFEGKRAGEGYFSTDGNRMIFQSERDANNPFYQMYMMDFETGDVTRLSTGIGKTTCGWLHPDGTRAMFSSTQFDPEATAKMQAELDFRASGETRRYAWDYDPEYDIVETRIGEGGFTKLTDAYGYDAEGAYSPDGTRIVFASNRQAYARDLDADEAAQLERDPAYFMDLYVMDADGSNLRQLTDVPGYDGGPFWSADGQQITWRRFSEDGARAEIFTLPVDAPDPARAARRLTDLDVLSWAPFFHPSGDYLIFSTNLQGFDNFELYLVDAAGLKEPVRITNRDGFDGLPTFAPDGKTISWTSNTMPSKTSQIFVGKWDHDAALALLKDAPARAVKDALVDPQTDPEITTDELRGHVAALTAPEMAGRLTGTEGERLATDYVARAFAAIGLTPAGVEGVESGWFQPFKLTTGVSLGQDNRLSLSVDGEAADLGKQDWTPLAFSQSGNVDQTPVVFAGYGLVASEDTEGGAMNSYGDLDVTDAWVLIWRGMPGDLSPERRTALSRFADMRYKVSVAKSRGAKGVIFAPPLREGFADELPELGYEATSGVAPLPVVAVNRASMARMLSILGGDLPDIETQLEAGETASTALIGIAVEATVDLKFEKRSGRNVIGRLELDGIDGGYDAGARPALVIGAHVDHLGHGETSGSLAAGDERGTVHPGADDNASGVAALIELAEQLTDLARNGKLNGTRDILFAAWSGEELGLIGASHFVEDLAKQHGQEDLQGLVSAYLNMDMIGRLEKEVLVGGLGSSSIWPREVERRNAVIKLPVKTSDDPYLPTDSTEFYLKGVPILSIFTRAHEDYHRPSDTADKLNYDGIRDIARFVALIARSQVTSEETPDYLEHGRPSDEGGRRMGGVFLGTIPDYTSDGVIGVPISGVVKGGPAEQAGLQAGDVLTGLAEQEIGNIYDYVRLLNGLKPGEAVPLSLLRDGAELQVEITPGIRQ